MSLATSMRAAKGMAFMSTFQKKMLRHSNSAASTLSPMLRARGPVLQLHGTRSLSVPAASAAFADTNGAAVVAAEASTSKLKDVAYSICGALAITIAGGVGYVYNNVGGTTEGLERTISFYSLAIPKYLTYRAHMILESNDETWDELDKETSQKGLDKILELGGFYIKSGQMAASNIGNGFPKIWQETMSVLQDECPSKPFDVVESEFGKPLKGIFSSFEERPIGPASIGQIHKATLPQDGQQVIYKDL